jgi:tetratricopeptide (TPR) repeat protein
VRCQPHFNRAVALEELDCAEDALNGYRKCLAIEPDYADAHYNLARLKELRGDKQGALRHYNGYRRIQGF